MDEDMKSYLGVLVCSCLLSFVGGYWLAGSVASNEAVREGHAVWTPGETGAPEWRWLPPCNPEKRNEQR